MTDLRYIPVSCNKDCGGGCSLTAHIEKGRITKITDSPFRPKYMQGCIKGYRSAETVYHKDRLKKPLIRTEERGSGDFREATWSEALDLISLKLDTLRKENRQIEILRLGGSGSCRGALHNTATLTRRFLSLFGGYTDTLGDYSSEASEYVKKPVFGTNQIGIDAATLFQSKQIFLWGFNPSDTRFDSEIEAVLNKCSQNGTPITVIDPRKTRTVKNFNARWIPIKPGSDSALMLAMLHVLIQEEKIDKKSLSKYAIGFDLFQSYISGESDGIAKTPRWASKLCGLTVEEIKELTHSYAAAKPTALLPGFSLQRAIGGENADRLGAVLQLATGNAGIEGGSIGSAKWNKLPKPETGKIKAPANPLNRGVPVYRWADLVLEGGISFLYNVGGNYIGQSAATEKTILAFKKAEFSVTHDYFLTDTARHCDVVLPVTTFLEREDIVETSNNYLFYSRKAIKPVGQSKNDYQIFLELAERLGFKQEFGEGKSEEEWLDHFLEQSGIDEPELFKITGIYDWKKHNRIGLADFFKDPDKHPLKTMSGKIEIASKALEKACGTLLPEHIMIKTSREYPLRMISPHEKYRIHSQNDNISSLKKLCDDRLWINPEDAESRGVKGGDSVKIVSSEGSVTAEAYVTEKICPGTVSMNQGVWAVTGVKGANVNYLTSTIPTLPSNGSRTHSIIVEVQKN